MVVLLAAGADIGPAALLLLEVEASGVGKEEGRDQHAEIDLVELPIVGTGQQVREQIGRAHV